MEWHPPAPTRPVLPPVGAFLRESLSLGVRSIRPALPAIVFLCFYRFGMGLYFEFAVRQTSPFGTTDQRAQIIHLMMALCAYLPLLVLIYLPFLPLQDALRREERAGFLDSVRRVLERFPALAGSGVIQTLVIGVPSTVLVMVGALFVAGAGTVSQEAAAAAVLLLLLPVLGWVALASFYFMFATPAVILDEAGPVGSIRASVSLVWRHFWGLVGRFFVWTVVAVLAYVVATFPATLLQIGAAVSGGEEPPPAKVARVLWTSVATALLLPFWVSAMLALYRAVVPGAASEGAAPGGGPAPAAPAPKPIGSDSEADPRLFE